MLPKSTHQGQSIVSAARSTARSTRCWSLAFHLRSTAISRRAVEVNTGAECAATANGSGILPKRRTEYQYAMRRSGPVDEAGTGAMRGMSVPFGAKGHH